MPAPMLIFGYGNPGRGDDALGPELVSAIAKLKLPDLECQSDMQLQVEHVTDLLGRKQIIFIDADASCTAPCILEPLTAEKDSSYTSHAMTPGALLYAFKQVYHRDPPPAQLLRIRGHQFELGAPMSEHANLNMESAMHLMQTQCLNENNHHESIAGVI